MSFELMMMVKKDTRKFEFDYGLSSYKDRVEFVKLNQDIINKSKKLINQSAIYILRSGDVESERKIDYSFYRDDSKFYAKGRGKWKPEDERVSDMLKNTIKSNRYSTEEELYDMFTSTDIDINESLNDSYVNRIFSYRNMEPPEIKRCIKEGIPVMEKILDENLKTHILGVYDFVIFGCKNDLDFKLIELYAKGISDKDIADNIGVSRQSIEKRFKKIVKNAKKGLHG